MGKWRGKQTFAKGFQEALWRSRGRDCAQCWQFGDGRVQVRIQYIYIEIFSQKIAITIEQNLRVLQAKREFVLDSGFQESRKISPSQVLGCGYGLM